jgi:hydroxyethylthiazole kinase-like uncharacterized protein yjeF
MDVQTANYRGVLMSELLTSAQMRAVEAAAIASGAVSGLHLMERAGRETVAAILARWPQMAQGPSKALVLCGPGNNGGDGFVVARLLRDMGWQVSVMLHGDAAALPEDARRNHALWLEHGPVLPLAPPTQPKDLVIDALFGIGLRRPLSPEVCAILRDIDRFARASGAPVVAVDVPSGLDADSGRVLGGALPADLTVTFHAAKPGHYLAEGPQTCGALRVVDIGLMPRSRAVATNAQAQARVLSAPVVALAKAVTGHKYSHGHAFILCGPPGKGGAARLAARGALRIGAGLVTLACPPLALAENAARLDAVMLAAVADSDTFTRVLADRRINALCLGPGLGLGEESRALVAAALGAQRATVLDADALSCYAAAPETLFAQTHSGCVLTPHAGEFARLFPDLADELAKNPHFSKIDAARAAAARARCVLVFKGPDTVIAAADGRVALNAALYQRAAPWLATAGAGDVLAGFITGLLARGHAPFDAAQSAAWLHVEAARHFGAGLIAEDLPDALPAVLRSLEV